MGSCSLSIKDSGTRFWGIGYRTARSAYRTLALRAIGYRRKARGDGYENSVVEEPRCFLLGELVELVGLVLLVG